MSKTILNTEELAAKLNRLFIVDDINNILDEEGVPMRFWLTHENIEKGKFLGFQLPYKLPAYLKNEERMNVNILRRIANSTLPYLRFLDSVLRKTQTDLLVKEMVCRGSRIDHTFECMYIELINTDRSASYSFTLEMNENGEVEASL